MSSQHEHVTALFVQRTIEELEESIWQFQAHLPESHPERLADRDAATEISDNLIAINEKAISPAFIQEDELIAWQERSELRSERYETAGRSLHGVRTVGAFVSGAYFTFMVSFIEVADRSLGGLIDKPEAIQTVGMQTMGGFALSSITHFVGNYFKRRSREIY